VLYYIRYEGYQEALESEKKKEVELEAMKEQFSGMQSQIQSLIMAFANMKEQTQFDSMAKTLYDSHILDKDATTAAKAATSTSMTTATLTAATPKDSSEEETEDQ
jgi:beta-phosphoglucomutase-like phosphatase (HAD superfamily)